VLVGTNAIASVERDDEDPSVLLMGRAIFLPRLSPSMRGLWDGAAEQRAVVDRPSWTVPPLWERPRTRMPESWAAPRALPAFKRTWRQPVLF